MKKKKLPEDLCVVWHGALVFMESRRGGARMWIMNELLSWTPLCHADPPGHLRHAPILACDISVYTTVRNISVPISHSFLCGIYLLPGTGTPHPPDPDVCLKEMDWIRLTLIAYEAKEVMFTLKTIIRRIKSSSLKKTREPERPGQPLHMRQKRVLQEVRGSRGRRMTGKNNWLLKIDDWRHQFNSQMDLLQYLQQPELHLWWNDAQF